MTSIGLQGIAAGTGASRRGLAALIRAHLSLLTFLVGLAVIGVHYLPVVGSEVMIVTYLGVEAVAVATVFGRVIVGGLPERRGWILFGLGMLAITIGDFMWYPGSFSDGSSTSVSISDLFYIAEYPLMIGGALLLFRARPEPASILDTLIVTVAALTIVLEFVVLPGLETYDGPQLGVFTTVAYPICDVALAAIAVRSMLVGDMRRSWQIAFLAGIGALVAADLLNLGIGLTDFSLDPSPTDGFWMLSMVLWAAASLHRSTAEAPLPSVLDSRRIEWARRLIMTLALMLPPVSIAVLAAQDRAVTAPISLLAWGLIVLFVIMRTDVAMNLARRSERGHRQASERLTLAVKAGGIGIWELDPDRATFTFDAQLSALYGDGWDREEVRYADWLARIVEDERADVDELFCGAGSDDHGDDEELEMTFRIVRPDGSIHYIRCEAVAQRSERSRFPYLLGTARDVTGQKEAEKEMRDNNFQLAIAMSRAIELAADADAASKAKSEFLANMSHEIRTARSTATPRRSGPPPTRSSRSSTTSSTSRRSKRASSISNGSTSTCAHCSTTSPRSLPFGRARPGSNSSARPIPTFRAISSAIPAGCARSSSTSPETRSSSRARARFPSGPRSCPTRTARCCCASRSSPRASASPRPSRASCSTSSRRPTRPRHASTVAPGSVSRSPSDSRS